MELLILSLICFLLGVEDVAGYRRGGSRYYRSYRSYYASRRYYTTSRVSNSGSAGGGAYVGVVIGAIFGAVILIVILLLVRKRYCPTCDVMDFGNCLKSFFTCKCSEACNCVKRDKEKPKAPRIQTMHRVELKTPTKVIEKRIEKKRVQGVDVYMPPGGTPYPPPPPSYGNVYPPPGAYQYNDPAYPPPTTSYHRF